MSSLGLQPLGDIGLTDISGPVGLGIRVGQWAMGDGFANFEHAFVSVGNGRIIEAMPGGALNSPLNKYNPANVVWLRCPEEFGPAVAAAARALEGTPYSFLDYAALAQHRFHIPGPGLQHFVEDSGHLICSQLCDLAAQRGGWHLFSDERWNGDVTPGDIDQLAKEQK